MVLRHDGTKGPAIGICDGALDGNSEFAARPLELLDLFQFAARLLGQGKRCVPQRTRADQAMAGQVLHLPVMT